MGFNKYVLLALPLAIAPTVVAYGAEQIGKQPPAGAVVDGEGAAKSSRQPPPAKATSEEAGLCDQYGPEFIAIPRMDTCIHVGGLVRINSQYVPGRDVYNVATGKVSQRANAQDTTGLSVRAHLILDARTDTGWGALQSFINVRTTVGDGLRNFTSPSSEFATSISPGGNSATTSVILERAFVKFGGLTAGVGNDNFSTIPPYMFGPVIGELFGTGVKQIAYTHNFGGGFSGTVALESKGDFAGNTVIPGNSLPLGPSVVPYATSVQYNNQLDSSAALIGNLRNDADWGFLQSSFGFAKNAVNAQTLTSAYDPLVGPTSALGWGAGVSGRYLMPFVAPGDEFRFQLSFTRGIMGLVAGLGSLNDYNDPMMKRGIGGIITVPQNMIPTTVTANGTVTSISESSAYSATVMYTHYWSKEWRSNADVGYMQVIMPKAYSNGSGAGLNTQEGNAHLLVAGANLIWAPSRLWDIGVEVDYLRLAQSIQNPDAAFVAAGMPGLKGDVWSVAARLQRRF